MTVGVTITPVLEWDEVCRVFVATCTETEHNHCTCPHCCPSKPMWPAACSHTFAWWSTVPPSRCPLCGAPMAGVAWPRHTITTNTMDAKSIREWLRSGPLKDGGSL